LCTEKKRESDGSLINSKSSEYLSLSQEIADLREEIATNNDKIDLLQRTEYFILQKMTDLVNFNQDEKARIRERRF